MREISDSIFPLQAADGVSPWGHIKVCGFLLSIVVFCAPLAWAQAPPPTEVAVETPTDAIPVALTRQAKVHRLTSDGKVSPNCAATLGQAPSQSKLVCAFNNLLLSVTNRSVLEMAAKQNDWSANAPRRWLANGSDDADDQSLSSRDLTYYGDRTPLIGKAIVRIAEEADSHPKITRMLLMLDPQF